MQRLTADDRGTFRVETRSSTHIWRIDPINGVVTVERYSSQPNPFGCDALNGRRYVADVQAWPEVGGCFLNVVDGGTGDVPWVRSSSVKRITRLSHLV